MSNVILTSRYNRSFVPMRILSLRAVFWNLEPFRRLGWLCVPNQQQHTTHTHNLGPRLPAIGNPDGSVRTQVGTNLTSGYVWLGHYIVVGHASRIVAVPCRIWSDGGVKAAPWVWRGNNKNYSPSVRLFQCCWGSPSASACHYWQHDSPRRHCNCSFRFNNIYR